MKYYLIAGEASGDLHASHLMTSILRADPDALFRFIGGDNMIAAAGERGTMLRHYRDLAYMGFIPVIMHLRTILNGMKQCKKDILRWNPDNVILVDYAGFNLSIAKFLREQRDRNALSMEGRGQSDGWHGRILYYIAPKIWAWKEWRIKNFKRDVDEMFCILPFEKEFFEGKHHYPVHYVGNPTAEEVRQFKASYTETREDFCRRNSLDPEKHIIAILAGSRRQEIKNNLIPMLLATRHLTGYQMVIAGAPGIEREYYDTLINENFGTLPVIEGVGRGIVFDQTYQLLSHATAALVTSGTATLETACFNVPQVVCYRMVMPKLASWCFDHILTCRYISLVNLIADEEVVPELFADRFSVKNIRQNLLTILPDLSASGNAMGYRREAMLEGYKKMQHRLDDSCAPDNAAKLIVSLH